MLQPLLSLVLDWHIKSTIECDNCYDIIRVRSSAFEEPGLLASNAIHKELGDAVFHF